MPNNPIKVGDALPAFTLLDQNNTPISTADFIGQPLVIFFYPKDNTPGCAIETKKFNDLAEEFQKNNIGVIGISGGDSVSKTKFCEKVGQNIRLLSDSNFKVCEKYGVYGEKKFMGRTYMGISRVTYILDKDKKVIQVYPKVKPLIHAKEVFDYLVK